MNTINIQYKAFGYKGADYTGEELALKKMINKDASTLDLTIKDLRSILEMHISTVKEIKKAFPDEKANARFHNDNTVEEISFRINYKQGEKILALNEKQFFKEVAEHEELAPLIIEYCNVTADGEEGTRIWLPESEDYESHPAGTHAIMALVRKDEKWIPEYINFLKTNDLDHEAEQIWHIRELIETYGWSKETIRLAIARNISCIGQAGTDQFQQMLEGGLTVYLQKEKNREEFIKAIHEEFDVWENVNYRLKDGSKELYLDYIVSRVENFKEILNDKEIETIKSRLLKRWDNYYS